MLPEDEGKIKFDINKLGDNSIVRYIDSKTKQNVEFQIQTQITLEPKPLVYTVIIRNGQVVKRVEKECAHLLEDRIALRKFLRKEHATLVAILRKKAAEHSAKPLEEIKEEPEEIEEIKEEPEKHKSWLSKLFGKKKKKT